MQQWRDLTTEDLAAERKRREARLDYAAEAAPRMADEQFLDVAGLQVFRCTPFDCAGSTPNVFVHGGGWVFGSSRQSLGLIRRVAHQTRRPILSPEFALSPEHAYPRAIEQVAGVLEELKSDTGVAGILGIGSGAEIAVRALQALPFGVARAAVLFCGSFYQSTNSWSHRLFGHSRSLTSGDMRQFIDAYAMPETAYPLDASGLPPIFLSVGSRDPLLADSIGLYSALEYDNGSELHVIPETEHASFNNWCAEPRTDQAITDALDWLERQPDIARELG